MTKIIVTENGNIRGEFSKVISASLSDSLSGECTFEFSVTSIRSNPAQLNILT